MADNITVVEVEMEPSKVLAIADRWAAETDYSLHERTQNRSLYRYDRHVSTKSWISIESLGENTRVSAWLAPKGLDPDAKGSFWKGNKVAIPVGFAMGPLGRLKKQFNALSESIKNESNNPLVISSAGETKKATASKDTFSKIFVWLGVFIFLYGGLNLYNGTNSMTTQLFPELARAFVWDGVVNVSLGVVFLICSILLRNGKALSIWLFGASVLFTVGQDIVKGADFPFFPILLGIWVMSELMGLRRQGQLA